MAEYNLRVIAEYDLTIEAEDEDEALELAARFVELGQEVPIEVNAEVLSSDEDEDETDEDY